MKIVRRSGGHVLSRTGIKALSEMLPEDQFVRVHRSYVVSRRGVEHFTKREVKVEGAKPPIPIGKLYAGAPTRPYRRAAANPRGPAVIPYVGTIVIFLQNANIVRYFYLLLRLTHLSNSVVSMCRHALSRTGNGFIDKESWQRGGGRAEG